jgi:DNA-binding NarL/FixJ family response regulator
VPLGTRYRGRRAAAGSNEGVEHVRVLIVEDHQSVGETIQAAVAREHRVVAVAASGRDAHRILAAGDVDCVILDLHLPDVDGFELLRDIRSSYGAVKIVVFTAFALPETRRRALAGGANGFVAKTSSVRDLLGALAAIAEGDTWFPDISMPHWPEDLPGHGKAVTGRRLDVLRAAAAGFPTSEIATYLGITPGTVEDHIQAVKERLGARTLAAMVHAAVRTGLISPFKPDLPPPAPARPGGDLTSDSLVGSATCHRST